MKVWWAKRSIFQRRCVCEGVAVIKLSALGLVVATAVVWSAPVTIDLAPTKTPSLSVDTADARLGRPLTPMSVAGVNRRRHRRALYGAAAAGAVGYGLIPRASLRRSQGAPPAGRCSW